MSDAFADEFVLMPTNTCLTCGAPLNAVAQDGVAITEPPRPGDLSLCGYCFAPMCFTDDMGIRPLTPAETAECASDIAAMRQSLALIQMEMEAQGWRNPYGRP